MIRSILLGQAVLYALAAVALVLAIIRPLSADAVRLRHLVATFLVGVACQCIHFAEEFATGFQTELPRVLGLIPWSSEFFVVFNLAWISVWVLAAVGVQERRQVALFPIWFFALGMVGNGVWHPLLAARTQGYFPGLYTSPVVGFMGILVVRRLMQATTPKVRAT